jgi:hypothetical protein
MVAAALYSDAIVVVAEDAEAESALRYAAHPSSAGAICAPKDPCLPVLGPAEHSKTPISETRDPAPEIPEDLTEDTDAVVTTAAKPSYALAALPSRVPFDTGSRVTVADTEDAATAIVVASTVDSCVAVFRLTEDAELLVTATVDARPKAAVPADADAAVAVRRPADAATLQAT